MPKVIKRQPFVAGGVRYQKVWHWAHGGVVWKELSDKRRTAIADKVKRLAKRYERPYDANKGIIVALKFFMCRMMHKAVAKNENPLSADNQHWVDRGWVKL